MKNNMKTPARLTLVPAKALDKYDNYYIEILHYRKDYEKLEIMGTIEFFKKPDADDERPWILHKYKVEGVVPSHFEGMAKIMRIINEKRQDSFTQPDEVKSILGIDPHVYFEGQFYPTRFNGRDYYHIMDIGNQLYTGFIASGPKMAEKYMKKYAEKRKLEQPTLRFIKKAVLV